MHLHQPLFVLLLKLLFLLYCEHISFFFLSCLYFNFEGSVCPLPPWCLVSLLLCVHSICTIIVIMTTLTFFEFPILTDPIIPQFFLFAFFYYYYYYYDSSPFIFCQHISPLGYFYFSVVIITTLFFFLNDPWLSGGCGMFWSCTVHLFLPLFITISRCYASHTLKRIYIHHEKKNRWV